jgi:septal ring factor EnvC (AmiA/AmiB activator)
VVRFRQRRYRLRWRLRRQLEPLGEAAYRGDEDRVEVLKAQARRMEEALRQAERETAAAVQAARAEVERERAFSDPTRSLPVQDPPDAAA